MFYAVEALLLSRELIFSKHSGVIAAFGKEFVKTGAFDSRFHRYLLNAFELRNAGDYGAVQDIIEDDVRKIIENAHEMLAAIENYLDIKD